MFKYTVKRLITMFIMIFVISFIIFYALQQTGVDPVAMMLGVDNYSAETAAKIRQELGLNDPIIVQFFRWWKNILQGDFGKSYQQGYIIRDVFAEKWPATIEITVLALIISTIVGILVGMFSAYRQNSVIDYLGRGIAVLGNSMPEYFFGLILIQIFSVKLGLLPSAGRVTAGASSRIPNLILPVAALAIPLCGNLMRYTRNTMLDVANQEYVKLARSKGIPEWKVYLKHIFRNSMRPVITILLFRLTILVGGSVAVESVFAWSGVGTVITKAVTASDYNVVMLYTLVLSVVMLAISFCIDLFGALLDPRVRLDK